MRDVRVVRIVVAGPKPGSTIPHLTWLNSLKGVDVRHFAFRPPLSMRGRKFKGVRGWAGKPTHPPLTDIPISAYVITAAFDVIAFIGSHTAWSREFYQAATFVLITGVLVSLGTVLTGVFDWWQSSEPGTQARRTINAHALIMVGVTLIVLTDLGLRWLRYHSAAQPPSAVLGLSLAAAVVVALGATYGGSLVFAYGFNVETAGDHPVWHRSEADVLPDGRLVHNTAVEVGVDGKESAATSPQSSRT